MNNSPLDYENKNEEQKKHSVTGIISSVIFVLQASIVIPTIFYREQGGRDVSMPSLLFVFLLVVGIISGIIAIFQRKHLKLFRYIGFWGNIAVLLFYILLVVFRLLHFW